MMVDFVAPNISTPLKKNNKAKIVEQKTNPTTGINTVKSKFKLRFPWANPNPTKPPKANMEI